MNFSLDMVLEFFDTAVFWFGTIVAAASIVVKATPTQVDDAFLARVVKILDFVSVFNAKIQKKEDSVDSPDAS